MVISKQNWSKSHPLNKIVLMYDVLEDKIKYASHHEKQKGLISYSKSYLTDDYKTCLKNNLKYIDVNIMNYWKTNKPLKDIQWSSFYRDSDFMYYYPLQKIIENLKQDISPWTKHIPFTKEFKVFHDEFTKAFGLIELNGIGVNTNLISTFGHQMARYVHDKKLYQNYNFFTTTSRPSNSIHNLNFAALTPEQRKCFSPLNDVFIEFDFDAYHPRLIGQLVDYKFPKTSVHEYLSEKYKVDVDTGKTKTFQYLYGGIPKDVAKEVEFLNRTKNLIYEMWSEFNRNKHILTHTYKRPLKLENLENQNPQKLFNYYIQSYETERNVKLLMKLHAYLLKKRTRIVHYNYDSFLFDYDKHDGVETIYGIKEILEQDGFSTKTKVGKDYGSIKNYEF